MNCPRCGTPMQGGVCPECGFPVNRVRKMHFGKKIMPDGAIIIKRRIAR